MRWIRDVLRVHSVWGSEFGVYPDRASTVYSPVSRIAGHAAEYSAPSPFGVWDLNFRVWDFRFWVSGFRFRVSDFGFRVTVLGFLVCGVGSRVSGWGVVIGFAGFGFRMSSLG